MKLAKICFIPVSQLIMCHLLWFHELKCYFRANLHVAREVLASLEQRGAGEIIQC